MIKVDAVCILQDLVSVICIRSLHGVNKSGNAKSVHAAYQITGDCPGFYLADKPEQMHDEGVFDDYAKIIYYNMSSNRTMREGFGSADML